MLIGCYLNLAQLVNLPTILRTKSAASISPPVAVATLVSCACWLIYGALLGDVFYVLTNAVGVLSALVQLGLVAVLPRKVECVRSVALVEARRDSGVSTNSSALNTLNAQTAALLVGKQATSV